MPPTWKCKNIHVIGAQSTGKTTLVNALEKHFADAINSADGSKVSKPVIIREVARTVLDTHSFTRDDIVGLPSRALDLQKLILHTQLRAEEAALSGNPVDTWFISDRSGLDAIVYAKHFVGNEAAAEMISSAEWKSLEQTMRAGLVVLCEAGCAWLVDDGTRLMPKDVADWLRFDSVFREVLDTVDMHTLVIPKDLAHIQDRVQAVLDALGFPLVKQA